MMKKILMLLITVALLLGIITSATEEKIEVKLSEPVEFLNHLGAFDKVQLSENSVISRGEFSAILSRVCRLSTDVIDVAAWRDANYGNDNKDTVITDDGQKLLFSDVDSSHPYYNEIRNIASFGYMQGISKNRFAPEYEMTLQEVLKVIVDMLGYQTKAVVNGGYPVGYRVVAGDLALLKGVNVSYMDAVTQENLAKIIYNALDIKIMKISSIGDASSTYETQKEKNFLTEILKLNKITGVVKDNGYTSLYGKSNIMDNQIQIGDIKMKVTDEMSFVRSYIGRNIKVYYSNIEDNENLIAYAVLTGKDSAVSFDILDFSSYTQDTISYYDNEKIKTQTVSKSANMIYNGTALEKFDKNIFDFDAGDVTLISSDTNECEFMIVNCLEFFYVDKINTDELCIYNKIKGGVSGSNILDLSKNGPFKFITIENAQGKSAKFSDIAVGSVLDVMRKNESIRIIIGNQKAKNFKVKESSVEKGKKYLKSDDEEYRLSEQYEKSIYKIDINVGSEYLIYLSNDGFIIWMERDADDYKAGFLSGATLEGGGLKNQLTLKIYTVDGEMKTYITGDKLIVIADDGNKYSMSGDEAYTKYIKGVNKLVRYKLSQSGLLSQIELPLANKSDKYQLYQVLESVTNSSSPDYAMNYTVAGDGGFGGHIQYDGNTKFIKIPKDLNKDSGYSIENESALWGSNNSRPVIIYACDPNSLIADYVVLKPKDSDSESNIVGISRTMVAVEKIYTGMYEDETVKIISGMSIKDSNLSEVKLMSRKDELIDSNGNKCSYFDSVTDTLLSKVDGKLNHYTIEEGDIIRCIYDEDGFVSAVELLYRPTAINPEFPNGVKGTILGSTGYYQSGVGNSNPFALKDDGSTENTNNKYWGHNACRFIYGFVYKTQQNLVQYTTLDLTQNQFDNGGYNGRYINEIIRMAENRMITVTYKGGNVKVTRGKISDVKSFEDEGTNCSRIIANCYWGTDSYIIMINGSMD